MFADVGQQHLDGVVPGLLSKQRCRPFLFERPVFDSQAKVLGKTGFTGAEKTGYPDADPLMGFFGGLPVTIKDALVMTADGLGKHIFLDLVLDQRFVGLVHLDDFLDVPVDLVGKQILYDCAHDLTPLEDFRSVVMFRIQDAHKFQAGGPVQLARVE